MKGMKKRLLALVLSILMICLQAATVFATPIENCPGGCSHFAAIGTTHYDSLEEAIEAAVDGDTITLLADIPAQAALTISKSITLDLGGKTLTGANTAEEVLILVDKDFTLRNGTVTTKVGTCLMTMQSNIIIEESASILAGEEAYAFVFSSSDPENTETFTAVLAGKLCTEGTYPAVSILVAEKSLANVTIEETASILSPKANALEFHGNGALTVNGGTFQGKDHAIILNIPQNGAIDASVVGGMFTSGKEPISILKGIGATAPAGFITGGTFAKTPAAYLADNYGVIKNSDGTYTVVTSFKLTFKANGGSGKMKTVSVKCGKSVKLPKNGFTAPKGKVFAGWKIGSKVYAAGKSYTPKGNVTVTAQWKDKTQSSTSTDKKPSSTTTTDKKPSSTTADKKPSTTPTKPHTHSWKRVAATAATCTKDGMRSHKKCSCGKLSVDGVIVSASSLTIHAPGHNWETVAGYPATCQEDGLKEHQKCTECGKLQRNDKTIKKAKLVIPAGSHNLETVLTVASTCKETGMSAHDHCTTCDQLFVNGKVVEAESLILPTVSHVLSDWYSDETEHWKCCVNCNDAFRQKSHADTDLDGLCNECGYTMPVAQPEEQVSEETESGFNWLFLIPVVAAVVIAVPLALKKRK